ncbi:kinase [Pseudoalteromonas fenneropenaei]|uniref:Kinase n=1 Tax=Pseudoalteromonas fenneropenaei TaxID=1737459 RepID=A0ABV7CID8_9GAMM
MNSVWQQDFLKQHQLPQSYLPAALKIAARLEQERQRNIDKPWLLAINGAQGSGKSTLAAWLQCYWQQQGIDVAVVSLDDYYLNPLARRVLAEQQHILLRQRGVPGTHDVERALRDFKAFKAGQAVAWPQFDKSLDSPIADRPARQTSIVIFEGWCVATPAQPEAELLLPVNALESQQDATGTWRHFVNQQLATSYGTWFDMCDYLVYLQIDSFQRVLAWRTLQEQQLRARTGRGMSDAEVADFIQLFERLTLHAMRTLPTQANLVIALDSQHQMQLKAQ